MNLGLIAGDLFIAILIIIIATTVISHALLKVSFKETEESKYYSQDKVAYKN